MATLTIYDVRATLQPWRGILRLFIVINLRKVLRCR